MPSNAPDTLNAVDIHRRTVGYPSPASWRDQILYFLLPDRFSDGEELSHNRPLFDPAQPTQYQNQDKAAWMNAGKVFQGGKIKGITSKLDYLQGLGVTALWIGPVFRQRHELINSYHGYGIQNFLDVDSRFGTIEDLVNLVEEAHHRKIYIILDIIYNHTGNNWFYHEGGQWQEKLPYNAGHYDFGAWRSGSGLPTAQIQNLNDGVWPKEFQDSQWYTRAGMVERWEPYPWEDPMHPENPFRRGDFEELKDLNYNEAGVKEQVLNAVIKVYQYWISLTDCDGFRIDTVKHLPQDVSRTFCSAIHEFAESIGKENFLLMGEIASGEEMIKDYLEIFGQNIDAALDIGSPAERLERMVKGQWDPSVFFDQFGKGNILGSHREVGRYHASILDDHDRYARTKSRFSAHNNIPNRYQQVAHAVGVQLTTLGIPCIYYGTEQAFDGTVDNHDETIEPRQPNGVILYADRYIRESMFGSEFGAFQTKGCHFFNIDHPTYLRIAAIAKIRQKSDPVGQALRRGRQYRRETAVFGVDFSYPGAGELVAWSRIMVDQEVLVVLNTNGIEVRDAKITIHAPFHPAGSVLTVLYRGGWSDAQLRNPSGYPVETVPVIYINGRATVEISLPPAGMVILA